MDNYGAILSVFMTTLFIQGQCTVFKINMTRTYISELGYNISKNVKVSLHLKACFSTSINLKTSQEATCNSTGKYTIRLKKEEIIIVCGNDKDKYEVPDVISCDEFRPFWVSWSDGYVQVGRGLNAGVSILGSKQIFSPDPIADIYIRTNGNAIGHVILQNLDKAWAVHLGMKEVNITDNVIWKQTTDHLGACSISCCRDPFCVSFTFNKLHNICQGHNVTYDDLVAASNHREIESDYFVTS